MREQQLSWVQKNHRHRPDPKDLSALIEGFQRSPRMVRLARQRLIVDIMERQAGPEFISRVAYMEQRGATLVFRIKSAAECYALGVRWRQILLRILQAQAPSCGIREVQFLPAESNGDRRE